MTDTTSYNDKRASLERLQAWESLQFGLFFHFGMSTFSGRVIEPGKPPPETYAPHDLNVGEWLDFACEVGARYAVLVCKHNSGFCVWPTETTDYNVSHSKDTTDVVGSFVEGCRARGLWCGLYYNWLDLYHLLEEPMPLQEARANIRAAGGSQFSDEYWDRTCKQLDELCQWYGDIDILWLDRGGWVTPEHLQQTFVRLKEQQPDSVLVANQGFCDGTVLNVWPTDVTNGEDTCPPECGHNPWRTIDDEETYVPMEVEYRLTQRWFDTYDDELRPLAELKGVFNNALNRNANMLLNLPPDRTGRLPEKTKEHTRNLLQQTGWLS